jgi:hypothetical protein
MSAGSASANYAALIQSKLKGFDGLQPIDFGAGGPGGPVGSGGPVQAMQAPMMHAPMMQGQAMQGQAMQGQAMQGQAMQAPPSSMMVPRTTHPDGMPSTMIGAYLVAAAAGALTLSLVIVLFARRR